MSRKSTQDVEYEGFEWNSSKSRRNIEKHKVTFEEASSVFDDPFFIIYKDPDHSVGEQRIIIGESEAFRYLIVSYIERGSRTRIISARELDPQERRTYEEKKDRV